MRSALQNLRTFGIMDVYLRTGCIGEPGRVVGTATSTGHRPKLLAMLFMLLIMFEDKVIEFGLNAIFK